MADAPARSWVTDPLACCHIVPSAEVSTTGLGPPTASQPAGPCVTLVSARRPEWTPATDCASLGEETSVQAPPPLFRHTAG